MRLHQDARLIFDQRTLGSKSRKAVKQEIRLVSSSRPVYSIAIGKAATSMALGLDDALGEKLTAGVIVSSHHTTRKRWQNFIGGHPLPNEASLAAARAAFALLDRANAEQATVIFLISGGGSAMIEWPSAMTSLCAISEPPIRISSPVAQASRK
jgi:hydroxypyruvate reductase